MKFTAYLVAYDTTQGESGVALVWSPESVPTSNECADVIEDFVSGYCLGPAPVYTLRYASPTDLAVLDEHGEDVTFNFACFRA